MPDWIVKYWVQWVFGLITSALAAGYLRLSKKFKRNREEARERAEKDAREIQALKNGVRSLLYRQLVKDCEDTIKRGYCPVDEKTTILKSYDSFKELGDDLAVRNLVQTIEQLPTIPLNT